MDARSYLRLLRRRRLIILLFVVLGTFGGAAMAQAVPPSFAASTQIYISAADPGADFGQAYQGSLLSQQRAKSYVGIVTGNHVLGIVIDDLRLPYTVAFLQTEVTAVNPADTAIIDITVQDRSAQRAKDIADHLGPVLATFVTALETPDQTSATTPRGQFPVVRVSEPAKLEARQVSRSLSFDVVLGLVIGLTIGLGLAVVREITDRRVHDAEDIVRMSGLGVLAVLPAEQPDRTTAVVEAYRRLAINAELVDAPLRSLLVTAPTSEAGVSAVAEGLAAALGDAGERVILVDASPGPPRPARSAEASRKPGLMDVLEGRVPLDLALHRRGELPMAVLGYGIAYPSEILRKNSLTALLDLLSQRADVVIFAGPPLLTRSDAVVLARVAGRTLLVADAKITRGDELAESARYLTTTGVTVLGAVLREAASWRGRRVSTAATGRPVGPDHDHGETEEIPARYRTVDPTTSMP
ncbi:MAG TPA: Wzz/FepE/Etk N-terminal domain-containing protein [Actinophytocola sp.]|uniref:Wzz/FepE/Etk N-terminal domain-containing protein n=1 Tax=Actinophytocola sp. TaxID=1872138 RepID=UPI002DF8437D|nr:Wzz/FepE/Etk N-terminal domain-containing protein [Actinophytocola sp.]